MAHGIVARFPGEPLAIVGLLSQGDVIARRLVDKVKELGVEAQYGSIDISLYRDDIFKLEARPSLRSSNLPFSTDDMRVVLVDDVLYTGRTIRAALNALFDYGPSSSPRRKVCTAGWMESTMVLSPGFAFPRCMMARVIASNTSHSVSGVRCVAPAVIFAASK